MTEHRRLAPVRRCLLILIVYSLSAVVFQPVAVAQTTLNWNLAPVYELGENTYSSTLADLDLDENLDIAVINSADLQQPRITLLYGNSSGQFNERVVYLLNFDPSAIAAGDLNHDGLPDLVVTGGFHNRIAVFLSLDGRTFLPPAISTPPEPPNAYGEFQDVRIGDFDADGNPDVVALQDLQNARLRFLRVDSQGFLTVFRTLDQITDGTSFQAEMETGDFNGDGILDVILGGGSGNRNLSFVFGRSSPPLTMDYGMPLTAGLADIHAADMDGDSDIDLVIAGGTASVPSIEVFANSGNGTFTFRSRLSFESPFQPVSVVAGDFNGDGLKDVAASVTDRGSMLSVAFGRPNGSFGVQALYSVPLGRQVHKGDFNRDGVMDLVTASELFSIRNNLAVLINDGKGSFAAPQAVPRSPTFMAAADFNSDGYKDLASAWATSGNTLSSVGLLINNQGSRFASVELNYPSAPALNALAIADLNGDGKPDAITGHTFNNRGVATYLGDGSGAVGPPLLFPMSSTVTRLTTGDFNNDGRSDVIALDENSHAHILLSIGNGSFSPAPGSPLVLGSSIIKIVPGQFTSDAFLDLVIPVNSGMTLFHGDGTGRFTASSAQIPTFSSNHVSGDFNGDGNLDLAGYFGTSIIAALGNGQGQFPSVFSRALNVEVDSLVSADFDLDGDSDVAFITDIDRQDIGNFVIVRSNGASQSWAEPIFHIIGGLQYRTWPPLQTYLIADDFNRDGKPDIAYYGAATRGVIYNTSRRSKSAPVDFDGDGKSDIGIFRPTVGEWWINRSSNGSTFATQFGSSTDPIVPADYTGDGKADIAVWRPVSGEWLVLRSEDFSFYAAPFGASGDVPVPADYDNDGKADLAVFRGSSATWFISRSTGGITIAPFGANGDLPVAADYDGDGRADLAVFRPSNGQWWLNRSTAGVIAFEFGSSTDKLVQGDYTGDGKADVGFWRPSTGEWFVLRSEDFSFFSAPFGSSTDIAAPGDYDGDGRYDFTVFRPASATWFSQRTTAGVLIQPFGATGDTPVANAFVR